MDDLFPTLDASMDRKFGSNQWVDSEQYVITEQRLIDVSEWGGQMRIDAESETLIVEEAIGFQSTNGIDPQPVVESIPAVKVGGGPPAVVSRKAVRRLLPVECERLQGFPDGWTDILYKGKRAKDAPRYAAIGNSMAVPNMRWLINRIRKAHGEAE